jgi:hypothetical protein
MGIYHPYWPAASRTSVVRTHRFSEKACRTGFILENCLAHSVSHVRGQLSSCAWCRGDHLDAVLCYRLTVQENLEEKGLPIQPTKWIIAILRNMSTRINCHTLPQVIYFQYLPSFAQFIFSRSQNLTNRGQLPFMRIFCLADHSCSVTAVLFSYRTSLPLQLRSFSQTVEPAKETST